MGREAGRRGGSGEGGGNVGMKMTKKLAVILIPRKLQPSIIMAFNFNLLGTFYLIFNKISSPGLLLHLLI